MCYDLGVIFVQVSLLTPLHPLFSLLPPLPPYDLRVQHCFAVLKHVPVEMAPTFEAVAPEIYALV